MKPAALLKVTLVVIALLALSLPVLSQVELSHSTAVEQGGRGKVDRPVKQPSDGLLGCQKNNPDRIDCSSLEVTAVCEGETAVFTIRNTGEAGDGDMRAPTSYRLIVDGQVVESGPVQIGGGATMQIRWSGGGTVTLEADQQTGHPGNSRPNATLTCTAPVEPTDPPTTVPTQVPPTSVPTTVPTEVPPTDIPTSVPTDEPTATYPPTEQPTEGPTLPPTTEPDPYELQLSTYCEMGYPVFVITNLGGDMQYGVPYQVHATIDDYLVDEGIVYLRSGGSMVLKYPDFPEELRLTVGDQWIISGCGEATPAPSDDLDIYAYCDDAGYSVFVIANWGWDMWEPLEYVVKATSDGYIMEQGTFQLAYGEELVLSFPYYPGELLLIVGSTSFTSSHCVPNNPTPTYTPTEPPVVTEEPTVPPTSTPLPPTPTPVVTDEPTTPPVEPTDEPTATSTPIPTDDAPLGCQKNNPLRVDCSSLEVTATCEGSTAVFTITNGGQAGEGDMRLATEYRLIVDRQVIETGEVLLEGRSSIQVRYDGGGRVTLQADQQIGHPGKSLPQATITCR
jgi:predicted RNA-binding protein with TRAM domain